MKEFVTLSPKVYASKQYIIDGSIKEHKKARGTNKNFTKKTLSFDIKKLKNYCKLSANSLAMITQFLQMSINEIMMLFCQNMLLEN